MNDFGELESLEEIDNFDQKDIWVVKDLTTYAVIGFRHYSYSAAMATLETIKKQYPLHKFEIRKVR